MLILSAVTISLTLGERGVFNLAQDAGNESKKSEATEKVNLKITQAQMKLYIEKQRLPSLQELADMFNIDNDFEYVHIEKKELAAVVEPFSIGNSSSIFVKLEDYTYEFEIDSSLRLASIDGVRLATAPADSSEYVPVENRVLYKVIYNGSANTKETSYKLNDSIENYDFIEVYCRAYKPDDTNKIHASCFSKYIVEDIKNYNNYSEWACRLNYYQSTATYIDVAFSFTDSTTFYISKIEAVYLKSPEIYKIIGYKYNK